MTRARAAAACVIVTSSLCRPADLSAQDATPPRAQLLHFVATWGEARVARASLSIACPARSARASSLTARTLELAEQVHPLRLRLDSSTPRGAKTPSRARTSIVEAGRARSYDSALAPGSVTTLATVAGAERPARVTPTPQPAHDLLIWALALGADAVARRDAPPMLVWDGWKLSLIDPGAPERARIITPAGVRGVWRVELTRARLDREASPPEPYGVVYYGDDALPVGVDLTTPLGATRARLARVETSPCD